MREGGEGGKGSRERGKREQHSSQADCSASPDPQPMSWDNGTPDSPALASRPLPTSSHTRPSEARRQREIVHQGVPARPSCIADHCFSPGLPISRPPAGQVP